MKNLQEIKDEFGVSKGFKDWEDFCICFFGAHIADSLDELFVKVAKVSLRNAHDACLKGSNGGPEAALRSILKQSNIPKL